MILYTDLDPFVCAVLSARVADGSLHPGRVLCEDVQRLDAETLAPYSQVHLFARIGGSPLGLQWAGWPADWSIVTGGFPCQDVSSAGKGAGLDGARSGLFKEWIRVVGLKRPVCAFGENVGALSTRGLDRVVGALGEIGYTAHAFRLGAWAVGSPQFRERWWIVAYESGQRCNEGAGIAGDQAGTRRGRDQSTGGDQARQLADLSMCGREAVGLIKPGSVTDEPSAGIIMGQPANPRLEGLGKDSGAAQVSEHRHASEPSRWPHKLRVDAVGRPLPTPQHEWEPPRLFNGSKTISARWRLALMGYPLNWLDLNDATVEALSGKKDSAKRAAWANKQGVIATGNAQVPQCVEVIARGVIEAARRIESRRDLDTLRKDGAK